MPPLKDDPIRIPPRSLALEKQESLGDHNALITPWAS